MKERLRCSVCSSSRLQKSVFSFKGISICKKCYSQEKELSTIINTFNLITESNTKELNDNKSNDYFEEKFFNYVNKIKKNYALKKEILNSVNHFNIDKTATKRVSKVINSFESDSLESCVETLKETSTVEDLQQKTRLKLIKESIDVPNPKDVYSRMSKNIIDQDKAVKAISMAVTKHFCRMKDSSIKKNNIMIMGPTGTGKTEIVKTLATEIKVPVITVDASSFTATGYKGLSVVDTVVNAILAQTKGNMDLARKCIVFIDEIDKKASSQNEVHSVNTTTVQQELLTMLQGDVIRNEKNIELDTSNIMFIAAGAFSGLEHILNKDNKGSIGLSGKKEKKDNSFNEVCTKDLVKYGFIPEFIGRFSTITQTEPLSKKSLVKILTTKTNSLVSQYIKIFKSMKIDAQFSNDFLEEVAQEAIEIEIGARGLDRILDKKLEELMFNVYDYIGCSIRICKGGMVKVLM